MHKDPILSTWKHNFEANNASGIFSESRTRPFIYLLNNNFYEGKPFILIAAGPSLDKNIAELKEKQNSCVIMCAEVILFKLIENGITPDYVVTIDPSGQFTRFLDGIDTSGLTYICPTTIHPHVIENWKGRLIFFNQEDIPGSEKDQVLKTTKILGGKGIFNKFFVGATMFQIANMLNPKVIGLVGYDFAFTDGKAYCDGFLERKIYDDIHDKNSPEWLESIAQLKAREVSKDNPVTINGIEIYTTRLYQFYKMALVQLIFTSGKLLFNCTEGGILSEVRQFTLKAFCDSYCTQAFEKITDFRIRKRR